MHIPFLIVPHMMTMYVVHEQLFLRVSYNNNSYHAPVNIATGGSIGHVRTTQIYIETFPRG